MLTVEDGTGVAGADSFVTLAAANEWWIARGAPDAWTDLDDGAKEARLREAAAYLGDARRLPFTGAPVQWAQSLCWPRTGATSSGVEIPDDVIPTPVKVAQIMLSLWGYQVGALGNTQSIRGENGNVASEQVGSLAVRYFSPEETIKGQVAADTSAPADLIGLLYPLLVIGQLPVVGRRTVPRAGAGAVLVDTTLQPTSFPDWP